MKKAHTPLGLLPLVLLLLPLVLLGQNREDITQSMPFFQSRVPVYEKWLQAKGFDRILRVDEVRFQRSDSNAFEMILCLQSTNRDTALALWRNAKQNYDGPTDTLEHYLYRNCAHIMEVSLEQSNLQVYIRDSSGQKMPFFRAAVWYKGGKMRTKTNVTKGDGRPIKVNIPPSTYQKTVKGKKITTSKTLTADQAFDRVDTYVNREILGAARYNTDELNDRKPKMELRSRDQTQLRFTLADLGKEVLTEQNRSFWEPWVGVNTIAMERLTFEFEYRTRSKEDGSGCQLVGRVMGKFGSGIFKPRTSGYMDMQPDFDDYLEKYATRLTEALEQELKK